MRIASKGQLIWHWIRHPIMTMDYYKLVYAYNPLSKGWSDIKRAPWKSQ